MSKKLKSNTKGVVVKLLKSISSRNRDIISRRFGLKSGRKETLESIGKGYGITRERVRQIEEATLAQLRHGVENDGTAVRPYFDLVSSILEEHGGILSETDLFDKFSGNVNPSAVSSCLVLLMTLNPRFKYSRDSNDLNAFWTLKDSHVKQAKQTLSTLVKFLNKNNQTVSEGGLYNFYKKRTKTAASQKATLACISLSKNISKNIFGEVGLAHWPEIKPRGVRDKAYLVLKRSKKPRHFREITKLINEVRFSKRKANTQTVHNELIKDKRFVLVGRGTYGLSEWGYKAGTVKDVLVDTLKEAKKSLSKDELVARVLSARFVKENTVTLNLQDSKLFKKLEDGTYTIQKA